MKQQHEDIYLQMASVAIVTTGARWEFLQKSYFYLEESGSFTKI